MLFFIIMATLLCEVHERCCSATQYLDSYVGKDRQESAATTAIQTGPPFRLLELPNEILLEIAAILGPAKDLNSLCRTNKALYSRLNRELYRLQIRQDYQSSVIALSKNGNIATANRFLKTGLDINHPADPALPYAVSFANINIVNFLLDQGADVNARLGIQGIGDTALFTAIDACHLDSHAYIPIINLLIQYGADVNHKSNAESEQTPLELSLFVMCLPVVQLLLASGADPNMILRGGGTVLHVAMCHDGWGSRYDVVRELVNAGADVGRKENAGQTPGDVYRMRCLDGDLEFDERVRELLGVEMKDGEIRAVGRRNRWRLF